ASNADVTAPGWSPAATGHARASRVIEPPRPRQATTRSEGAASPASGLAVLENPEPISVEVEPTRFGEQARGRLLERLLGQIKGTPVDRHEVETPDVGQHAQRLLGRRVARLHDHGRQVGADRNRGDVERAQSCADLLEPAVVRRIAREVEALGAAGEGPAAPEPAVAIPRGTAREVLGRDRGQREPRDGATLPPVQLFDLGDTDL